MDTADVAWLQTPAGERAANDATTALAAGTPLLEVVEHLRRTLEPAQARAAVALAEGRRAAARKFPDGARLYGDRDAAEQATSDAVARRTAARFAGARRIVDIGCGMGGDALALAAHAPLLAVDRDPARLAMLAANARVRGLAARIETRAGDAGDVAAEDGDAAWLDPSRRDARGRALDPRRWSPPLDDALAIAARFPAAGIKLAPGIDLALLPETAEVEFISRDGDLVEAVAWLGRLARARRRATVLPAGASLADDEALPDTRLGEPGAYLYDPDPSVGRAGLVARLARDLDAWQLDATIAYASGDRAVATPFARRFRIDAWLPFAERALLARLRALGVGRVEVMRRGSPVDTNALERRLNRALAGAGDGVRTVALTRLAARHIAIVCERERDAANGPASAG
jgi:SAM-dependent methyltransferase